MQKTWKRNKAWKLCVILCILIARHCGPTVRQISYTSEFHYFSIRALNIENCCNFVKGSHKIVSLASFWNLKTYFRNTSFRFIRLCNRWRSKGTSLLEIVIVHWEISFAVESTMDLKIEVALETCCTIYWTLNVRWERDIRKCYDFFNFRHSIIPWYTKFSKTKNHARWMEGFNL